MTLHQSQYFCLLGQPQPWLFFWVFPSVLIFIQTLEGCLFLEKGHTNADNGYIYNNVLFAHQGLYSLLTMANKLLYSFKATEV